MTAEALTYDSLLTDVQIYAERDDYPFVAQIPRFVMLAENRIASEVRGLGFMRFVDGTLSTGTPTLAKPVRWRESISLCLLVGAERKWLLPREYQYCRAFAPDSSVLGEPRIYADYDYEHLFLAATPDQDYAFELAYYERPEPLSTENQTSWTTRYAPQLLLYATLLEAQPFLKLTARTAEFQGLYDRAVAGVKTESTRRMNDQTQTRTDG
jgi:hypothetical protein